MATYFPAHLLPNADWHSIAKLTGRCSPLYNEIIREVDGTNNHGGIRSRGYGGNDARNRDQAGDTLEPQVNMRKFDRSTGKPINDKRINGKLVDRRDRVVGDWRAEMVTLPLVSPVRELQASEATYPVAHSPFAREMSRDEKIRAGFAE